ncbi:diguanylate cyclase domain-containing protein [Agrobacterium sp.]|uniref:diguanylate cyclase domain-containing protein n=1 Tax=Agrobacterium sp. TaxID=361 RepID=UPI0028A6C34F|nr:diguanylate cyclase [Agrobacterium sp.]
MAAHSYTTDDPGTRLELFDFAFDHAPIGIALVDLQGRILRANAAFAKLVGIPIEQVIDVHFRDFTHPDDLEADLILFEQVLQGKRDGYTIEKRYIQPLGTIVDVLIHVAAMRDGKGRVVRFISQIEDITRHKEHERQLAERAAQLELALEAVRGGFWQMDIQSGKFETSDRLAQFIGGQTAARLDLERYVSRVNINDGAQADLTPLISGELDQNVAEYRLDTIHGERWMRCDRRLLRDGDGRPVKIVGMAIDFTEERRRIEQLEETARTDVLTGLLNRRGLADEFSALSSADGFVVLALDLDGFKQVNDLYGHGAGDMVLCETAQRIQACVRKGDLVARTGGDEFVVVVAGSRATGMAAAERILEKMRDPVSITGGSAHVRASIGGVWTASKRDIQALINEADMLLYDAKASGKDAMQF